MFDIEIVNSFMFSLSVFVLALGALWALPSIRTNLPLIVLTEFILSKLFFMDWVIDFVGNSVTMYAGLGVIMWLYMTIFRPISKNLSYSYLICAAYYTLISIETGLGRTGMFDAAYYPFVLLMSVLIVYFSWDYNLNARVCVNRFLPRDSSRRSRGDGGKIDCGRLS